MAATNAAGVGASADGPDALEEPLDPPEAGRRLVQRLEAELDGGAVVRRDHVVAQLDPAHPLEHVRAPAVSCRATCSSSRRSW